MKKVLKSMFLVVLILSACKTTVEPDEEKPRIIITTDGEVDDMNGFIRFLLYSNEFDIEGLVYSSSQWHWAGDGKGTLFTSKMPNTAERYGERSELRWTGTNWMQDFIATRKPGPKLPLCPLRHLLKKYCWLRALQRSRLAVQVVLAHPPFLASVYCFPKTGQALFVSTGFCIW